MCIGYTALAQLRPHFITSKNKNVGYVIPRSLPENNSFITRTPNETVNSKSVLADVSLMQSLYDVPTNHSTSEKIYLYPDGSIGVCAMIGHDTNYADRGTGYNFFDGSSWGQPPTVRSESVRTGWPCLAPCGSGEITMAHWGGHGLVMMKRATVGSGAWTESVLDPPSGAAGLFYPRIVTTGPNRETVHVLCLTSDTINGGTIYNGLDGALIYNRSIDGGLNWEGWRQLDGLNSTNYRNFTSDCYIFAEPKGDTLAFAYGDYCSDFAYLKSTDNGLNWTRSQIWANPHLNYTGSYPSDTFNTIDGNIAAALDNNGKLHVVAGFIRAAKANATDEILFPWMDGLLYWNEDMPQWNPILELPTLFANGNLIGWTQDTNVLNADSSNLRFYHSGMSSQASMVIDPLNQIFVIWSGVTNNRDITNNMYRRIFARASGDGGLTWCDTIVALTTGPDYDFTEAAFTAVSPTSNDKLQIVIQTDSLAGTYNFTLIDYPSQLHVTTNNVTFLNPTKASILCSNTGIEVDTEPALQVSVIPNPVQHQAQFFLVMKERGEVNIRIENILGQEVCAAKKGMLNSGRNQISLDVESLKSGVYFYTVYHNNVKKSGKMVIKR